MIGLPLYSFRGKRPQDGYQWNGDALTHGAKNELLRALCEEDAEPVEENPALFREFAGLASTKEAIKGFADRYGALRADGDTFEAWTRAIAEMHDAAQVFDAVRQNDTARLQTIVRWEVGIDALDPRITSYFREQVGPRDGLSPEQVDALLLEGIQATYAHVRILRNGEPTDRTLNAYAAGLASPRHAANDLRMAGYVYLIDRLNDHMLPQQVDSEAIRETRLSRAFMPRGVGAHFALVDNQPGIWLQLKPETLIDALWLQLGRGMLIGADYRQCENERCRRWFEVSTDARGANRNRKYCGRSSCKVQVYQAKPHKAASKKTARKADDRRNNGEA